MGSVQGGQATVRTSRRAGPMHRDRRRAAPAARALAERCVFYFTKCKIASQTALYTGSHSRRRNPNFVLVSPTGTGASPRARMEAGPVLWRRLSQLFPETRPAGRPPRGTREPGTREPRCSRERQRPAPRLRPTPGAAGPSPGVRPPCVFRPLQETSSFLVNVNSKLVPVLLWKGQCLPCTAFCFPRVETAWVTDLVLSPRVVCWRPSSL